MEQRLLDELRTVVGAEHVLVADDMRAGYEVDWTGRFRGRCLAVVLPGSTAEVAAAVAACAAAGVAVVPQGGNTGLVGGGVPRDGGVVLSMRRLAGVGPLDSAGAGLVCGAGATLAAVQEAATAAGFVFGVDMAARGSATIGGMVATNAGGTHVLRYGAMSAQVRGLEAVLADGTVVGAVPALEKDNAGYDWAGLLCGSEGTLGIVTNVHLRLLPRLPYRSTALVAVAGLGTAVDLVRRVRPRLPSLETLEVFEDEGVRLVCEHYSFAPPFPSSHGAYLLFECAGTASPSGELSAALADAPEVTESAVAEDGASRARLWRYREGHTSAVNSVGVPHKFDVSLPLDRLAAFAAAVRPAVEDAAPGSIVVLFGHIGDGNLHVNVVGPAPQDTAVDDAVMGLVASMGGSISAEHGIGIAKAAYLPLVRTEAEIAAMLRVRRALDPAGILNPGVIFARP